MYTCRVLRQLVVLNRTLATVLCRLCQHVLAVAINAVCLALIDAGIPMVSVITASSCGIAVDGCLNLDPSSVEEEVLRHWCFVRVSERVENATHADCACLLVFGMSVGSCGVGNHCAVQHKRRCPNLHH